MGNGDGATDRQLAVVTDGQGTAWGEEREVPTPGASDVLVEVQAVGICGSDVGLIDGEGPPWTSYPVVLGHEVCAEVVEPGRAVESLSPGDRVALHGFIYCGRCSACREGRYHQCDELAEIGFTVDGGYRRYAAWPAYTLVPIPDDIPDAAATQIDTAGCMLHSLKRIDPGVSDTAAVLGAGPMGLFGVQLLQVLGVTDIVVTGLLEDRLATAAALGANHTVNAGEEDPVAALREYTAGDGIDLCVEAAGAGDVMDTAVRSAARQGQIVVTGVFDGKKALDPTEIVAKELTVVGGATAANAVPEVIELFSRGDLTADGIVTHEFDLADYESALQAVRERRDGLIKGVLRP